MRLSLPLLLAAGACASAPASGEGASSCEESPQALVQEPSATVVVGARSLQVEVATTADQLVRGVQHRRCDFSGLMLVNPEQGTPLPIWMCEVVQPLDIAFIREGIVVDVVRGAAPCAAPCDSCPTFGEGRATDAVVETPADSFPLEVGDTIEIH